MGLKKLCGLGGVLSISMRRSDTAFPESGLTLHANVTATLTFDGQRVFMLRGSLKSFASNGEMQLDMANTRNRQYPNSIIEGAEDILNVAAMSKVHAGLKAKNAQWFRISVTHDGTNWIKTDQPTTSMEELAEGAKTCIEEGLAAVTVQEATVAPTAKKEKAAKAFQKQ